MADFGQIAVVAAPGDVRDVQLMPSGDVMMPPLPPTATNSPSANVIEFHDLTADALRDVHVIPSGDVMTWFAPSYVR